MAFGAGLAALLAGLGARNKSRAAAAQQQVQNQQKNQALGLQQQQEQDYRTINGLNAQGQRNALPSLPKPLTEVNPGNRGVAAKPGSRDELMQQFQHAASLASFYARDPDPQAQAEATRQSAIATQFAGMIKQMDVEQATAARAAAQRDYTTSRDKTLHGYRMEERATPTYANLHPRATRTASTADTDTVGAAEAAIAKSSAPRTTAEGIIVRAQAAGANAQTIERIRALGSYYQSKWNLAHPKQAKSALDEALHL